MTRLEDYLSAAQCAELAGIEPDTFTSYVSRGQNGAPAPAGRVAGRRVWVRADIEAWIAERKAATRSK